MKHWTAGISFDAICKQFGQCSFPDGAMDATLQAQVVAAASLCRIADSLDRLVKVLDPTERARAEETIKDQQESRDRLHTALRLVHAWGFEGKYRRKWVSAVVEAMETGFPFDDPVALADWSAGRVRNIGHVFAVRMRAEAVARRDRLAPVQAQEQTQ